MRPQYHTDLFPAVIQERSRVAGVPHLSGVNAISGVWRHGWVELAVSTSDAGYVAHPSARRGYWSGSWATEVNNVPANSGQIVWLRHKGVADGVPTFEFQQSIGSGVINSSGRLVIVSGDIRSGNLSAIDWPISIYPAISGQTSGQGITYNVFLAWVPTYVDVNVTGLYTLRDNDTKLAFGSASNTSLTGIAGGVNGRILVIWNRGAGKVVLQHSTTTPNGIICPLASDYTLWPNDGVTLEYDGSSQLWRFDNPTFAGSSGLPTTPGVYALRHLRFTSGLVFSDAGNGVGNVTASLYGASGNCGGLTWSGTIVTAVTCQSGTLTVTDAIFYFSCGLLQSVTV